MTGKKPAGTPGMAEHTCNLSTEAGGFLVESLTTLQSEFKVSLSYTVVCPKGGRGCGGKERGGDGIGSSASSEGEKETQVPVPALPPVV